MHDQFSIIPLDDLRGVQGGTDPFTWTAIGAAAIAALVGYAVVEIAEGFFTHEQCTESQNKK